MEWIDADANPGPANAYGNDYRDDNVGAGEDGSVVPAEIFNALQKEMLAVIVGAGITPSGGDLTQLLQAINALIAAATPVPAPEFVTGDIKPTLAVTAPAGWVKLAGGTVGDADSGASVRAHADCAALFALIWNNLANGEAPLYDSAGTPAARGVSAAADWAAHRRIAIPDARGRAMAGAGTGSGLTARALGAKVGTETHTLNTGEMPAHTHGPPAGLSQFLVRVSGDPVPDLPNYISPPNIDYSTATATGSAGGGGAHNNMQPTLFVNWLIKL